MAAILSYKNQHIVPKAYLKYFATDKFVNFIELRNPHRKDIRHEGIGHKVFCKSKYYNINGDPALERAFGRIESNDYETVIKRLRSKSNIGYETKQLLIDWILMLKTRNTLFRDNISDLLYWTEKTKFVLIHGREAMKEKDEEFKLNGLKDGKTYQLMNFLDKKEYKDLKKMYSINFLNRHWTILNSGESNFITSDNPGFSISHSKDFLRLNLSPLSSSFNLDNTVNSTHYFPLTNKMCLCLFPILEGDLPELNESEMKKFTLADIRFSRVPQEILLQINRSTIETSYELIISNKKEDLEDLLAKN